MRSLVPVFFALFVTFKSTDSQYNWFPDGFGYNQNPRQSFQSSQHGIYSPQQPLTSNYPQMSNSFYPQPSNSFYPSPSYRFYPKQAQNSFYPQPSNVNQRQPQPNSYNSRVPQNPTALNAESRLSERKCEEYLKMTQRNVSVSSLTLRPAFNHVIMDNCEASQGLIIKGENAKSGEFPHMTAIGYKDKDRIAKFVCGGSLISDQFVLTAAHCRIFDGKASSIVRLGVLNLKVKERSSSEMDIAVKSFINHEKYDSGRKKNDIAVIELVSRVTFSKFIRPACLMAPNNHDHDKIDKVIVTGWGLTEAFTGHTSDILQKAKLTVKDNSVCRNYLEDENIDSSQICAGDKGRDTCSGDSGGPLEIISPKNKCAHIIVGITSYGSQFCGAANSVAVYTRVSAYVDWIEQKVWGNGT